MDNPFNSGKLLAYQADGAVKLRKLFEYINKLLAHSQLYIPVGYPTGQTTIDFQEFRRK